jgi:hypothetical protein
MQKHREVDVMMNFASLRSAYDATIEALTFEQVSLYDTSIKYLYSTCIIYNYYVFNSSNI